jgi:putative transcriptional regulator
MAKKIKVNVFDDMRQSLRDALAYERGQGVDLCVTKIPARPTAMRPEKIRQVRESLNASQAMFARFLCLSIKAVQAWEQGARRPQSAAQRLLDIAKRNPSVLLKA